MTKTKASAVVLLLFGILSSVVACALFPTIDVTGTWTGLLTWAEGDPLAGFTSPITLVLVQEEKAITGEVQLAAGGAASFTLTITSGSAQGQSFTISASGQYEGVSPPAAVTVSLQGTGDEEQLSGMGTQTIDGVPHSFTWQASVTETTAPVEGAV